MDQQTTSLILALLGDVLARVTLIEQHQAALLEALAEPDEDEDAQTSARTLDGHLQAAAPRAEGTPL